MKERPILFSTPMVRAVLAGTKTQTRRVVRKQFAPDAEPAEVSATSPEGWQISGHSGLWWDDCSGCIDDAIRCPYGQPRDRLWVREAWRVMGNGPDDTLDMFDRDDIQYRADDDQSYIEKYRPSIHMPRRFSRIDLEIVSVRVERLNDISESDSLAEGVNVHPDHHGKPRDSIYSPVQAYRDLWDSINGAGSWAENPWVWVVEFKRIG